MAAYSNLYGLIYIDKLVAAIFILAIIEIMAILVFPYMFFFLIILQAATKWSTRKEALEQLEKLTSNAKLEAGQYGEVMAVLKKVGC